MNDRVPIDTPSGEELLRRARELVPQLRERATQTEAQRFVPAETVEAFRRTELLKAVLPKRYGGFELEFGETIAIISELARGCASSAWVYAIFCDHQITIGMFPGQAQEDVWRDTPAALASSGLAPSGKVARVSGGYQIEGRWSFSSGCDHADWVFVQSMAPGSDDQSAPTPMYFLLPRSQFRIIDNWHVVGLCGTGSKDIEIDSVFVPEHRTARIADINESCSPGASFNDGPLFKLPRAGTVPFTLGAPAIGAAQSLYDAFVEMMRSRGSRGFALAEQATIQVRVAEAAAEIDAARLLVERDCRASMAAIRANGKLTLDERARNRRDMAYAVKLCRQAAERLFSATGGAGLYTNTEMQRLYRDVLAISHHYINSWDISATTFGRIALGLKPIHPAI